MAASKLTPHPTSSAEPRTKVRVLADWTEFEKLRAPWDELAEASRAGIFVSHEWLTVWYEAFGGGHEPRVVLLWRDGQLVAAAPFCLTSRRIRRLPLRYSVQCLSMMSNHETPFSQLLVAPGHDDAVKKMLNTLADKSIEYEMCQFEPIRDDARLEDLREGASRLGLPSTWCDTTRSVTVDISEGWDAYLAAGTKSFRKKIRRERRNLAGANHRWWRGDEAGPELIERALAVSVKSWKGRSGTSIGSTDHAQAFYRGLWETFGPDGLMQLNVLEINGADAGCLIALRGRDVVYGMKIDFIEEFRDYSPGRMMVADFVERSARAGLREVDMLRQSPFTAEFCKEGYGLGRFRLFPRWNLPALWYSLEERLRPVGRGWRRRKRRERRGRGVHTT